MDAKPLNEIELDLLDMARHAAASGLKEGRRAVMQLTRKHRLSELGDQLRNVCLQRGIPVEAEEQRPGDELMQSEGVLKARETMDLLYVIARGDSGKLKGFRVALDYALSDFGAKQVLGQLNLLMQQGEAEAARAIAVYVSVDERKSYASVGRSFLRGLGPQA